MTQNIDKYISQNKLTEALSECIREQQYNLGFLLCKACESDINTPEFNRLYLQLNDILNKSSQDGEDIKVTENIIDQNNPKLLEDETNDTKTIYEPKKEVNSDSITKVMMLCNWCESKTLCDTWNKMTKGNYTWNNIRMVWEEPCDYYVVINCPPITVSPIPEKIILFHMEPHMVKDKHKWGDWAEPPDSIKFRGTHNREYNNNEWHLSKTYTELSSEQVIKDDNLSNTLSTVLSDKYNDPGHIVRVDFVKFLERKGFPVHVYGGNRFEWKDYKGTLPLHCKDNAMFPYKYAFNAENHEIRNYYSEKLIDGILAECLVFYWGCPNVRDFIDENAYVQLSLVDFDKDLEIINRAIQENWWEKRIDIIRKEKHRILNELQLFPRLERILNK